MCVPRSPHFCCAVIWLAYCCLFVGLQREPNLGKCGYLFPVLQFSALSSAIPTPKMLLPGGALFRRHVREGRGKGNAWLPVRLLVVAALGNLGNRMLHLLLPSQPQVRIDR